MPARAAAGKIPCGRASHFPGLIVKPVAAHRDEWLAAKYRFVENLPLRFCASKEKAVLYSLLFPRRVSPEHG
jgi:hypothetical protein